MPNPEIGPVFALFPPLMKMPSGPWPPALPALLPPAPLPDAAPPGVPGLGPSGEIETRAERFPAGIAGGGATGAGVAESAMSVSFSPASSVDVRRGCVRIRFSRGRARRGHRIHRQQRLRRGLRGRSNVDCAGLFFRRRDFRRGDIRGRERCGSLRPQGRELLRGELQLRALRLRARELHNIGKRRQNFGRLLRRFWLDQRLPRMRRMQRFGKNAFAADGTRRRRDGAASSAHPFRAAALGARTAGRIAGKSFAGPYQVISVGALRKPCAPGEYSRWEEETGSEAPASTIAAAKAYFGNLWSIQQSRKYAPSGNSFGGAGPRTQRDQAGGKLLERSRLSQRKPRSRQAPAKSRTK